MGVSMPPEIFARFLAACAETLDPELGGLDPDVELNDPLPW